MSGAARLRVGFDGRALASPAGGVRRYTRELFGAMGTLHRDVELVALGPPPGIALPPHITALPAAPTLPTNLGWTVAGLPLTARGAGLDVYHGPAYTMPLWGVPAPVLTLHDVSYARHPEWYPYRRDPLRRAFYRTCARRAKLLITDSEFSRHEIQAAYGIEPDRIAVVPLGVGKPFEPLPGGREIRSQTGTPYVIHVGDVHPRRNLDVAVRAVMAARRDAPALRELRLLLVGVDRGGTAALRERARQLGQVDCLVCRQGVTDTELADLYRSAVALVYPSRYEGFGLPLVEAMACGTPVIGSSTGSIPEVAGAAGWLCDPDDVDGFAAGIVRLATDGDARAQARAAAIERSAGFSWRRTAEETVEVYRRVTCM